MLEISQENLIKLKQKGIPDHLIAKQMGISVAALRERWNEILKLTMTHTQNGYDALCQQYSRLCLNYQNVGEKLSQISSFLGSTVTKEEVLALIDKDNPEQTAWNLLSNFVILRKFVPPADEAPPQDPTKN